MRTRMILALLLASVTGAGAQTAPKAGDQAFEEWKRCMMSQAVELDDGRSDARSVGSAVTAACRNQRSRTYASVGISPEGVTRFLRELRDQDVDDATAYVLKARMIKGSAK